MKRLKGYYYIILLFVQRFFKIICLNQSQIFIAMLFSKYLQHVRRQVNSNNLNTRMTLKYFIQLKSRATAQV